MTTDIGATRPGHDLAEIASRVVHVTAEGEVIAEPELGPILGDAVIEMGWRHPAVMPLVLGVSLDDEPPREVRDRGFRARQTWELKREAGYELAQEQWDLFAAGSYDGTKHPHPKWIRAVYAVLLFEAWLTPMRSTPRARRWSTRSPWPLVRQAVGRWNDAEEARPPSLRGSLEDDAPLVYAGVDVWIDGQRAEGVSRIEVLESRTMGEP